SNSTAASFIATSGRRRFYTKAIELRLCTSSAAGQRPGEREWCPNLKFSALPLRTLRSAVSVLESVFTTETQRSLRSRMVKLDIGQLPEGRCTSDFKLCGCKVSAREDFRLCPHQHQH